VLFLGLTSKPAIGIVLLILEVSFFLACQDKTIAWFLLEVFVKSLSSLVRPYPYKLRLGGKESGIKREPLGESAGSLRSTLLQRTVT
jgi:hypothetical protein